MVGGRGELIDSNGYPLGDIPVQLEHSQIEKELLTGRGSAIIHSAATYRRDAVLAVGGYDERWPVSEDLDLFLKLAERGQLANLPEIVIRQRRYLESYSTVCNESVTRQARRDVLRQAYTRRGWNADEIAVRDFYQPRSQSELYLTWSIIALRQGRFRTAAKYGRHLLSESWWNPVPWCQFAWGAVARPQLVAVRGFLKRMVGRVPGGAMRSERNGDEVSCQSVQLAPVPAFLTKLNPIHFLKKCYSGISILATANANYYESVHVIFYTYTQLLDWSSLARCGANRPTISEWAGDQLGSHDIGRGQRPIWYRCFSVGHTSSQRRPHAAEDLYAWCHFRSSRCEGPTVPRSDLSGRLLHRRAGAFAGYCQATGNSGVSASCGVPACNCMPLRIVGQGL